MKKFFKQLFTKTRYFIVSYSFSNIGNRSYGFGSWIYSSVGYINRKKFNNDIMTSNTEIDTVVIISITEITNKEFKQYTR